MTTTPTMEIILDEKVGDQHRLVISVNGREIDIIADEDGLNVDITDGENEVLSNAFADWDNKS